MTAIRIGGRTVGAGEPVYVIAEAGVNHDGDVDKALALVDTAAEAGADAVKFQTFRAAELVGADAPQAAYQRERAPAEGQLAMLRQLELAREDFERIAAHARERQITFLSSPFDAPSAELLAELGAPAFKIGSGELTNHQLLEAVACLGRPMIASTGMADLAEVGAAVAAMRRGGAAEIALLHCVSSYPAPAEQANLLAMDALRDAHPDVVVGYSDHCLGLEVSLASVALGANILERHLTLARSGDGPDHAVSLEPAEFAELVRAIRVVERARGTGAKEPQPSEADVRSVARRSLVAAARLEAGHVLGAGDVTARRPGTGIAPSELDRLVGRELTRPIDAGAQLTEEDFA